METNNVGTKQILVSEYVYEKVLKENVSINIPESPLYIQEYNCRVLIAIIPEYATWDDSGIYQLKIVEVVSGEEIRRTEIRLSNNNISDIVSRLNKKEHKSGEERLQDKVIRYLKDYYLDDQISEKRFIDGYHVTINKFNQYLDYKFQ